MPHLQSRITALIFSSLLMFLLFTIASGLVSVRAQKEPHGVYMPLLSAAKESAPAKRTEATAAVSASLVINEIMRNPDAVSDINGEWFEIVNPTVAVSSYVPAGTEVFLNERFSFPPFPEAHTHTVVGALAPITALGSDGRDWAPELTANDEALAAPFDELFGEYQGLADAPYTLELAFDGEAVRSAEKLRLLLNGWLFWTDASVNVAAPRHPAHAFVPPTLQVPDGQGGWRDTGPPIGFPAGKLKTMVVDVSDLLDPEACSRRPYRQGFLENAMRLGSPLL